jgi:hypothetical protein
MMKTIEVDGIVGADHTVTLKLPDEFPLGACRIVVVSEPAPPKAQLNWASLPAWDVEMVDPNETFRREDMYGDDGR